MEYRGTVLISMLVGINQLEVGEVWLITDYIDSLSRESTSGKHVGALLGHAFGYELMLIF